MQKKAIKKGEDNYEARRKELQEGKDGINVLKRQISVKKTHARGLINKRAFESRIEYFKTCLHKILDQGDIEMLEKEMQKRSQKNSSLPALPASDKEVFDAIEKFIYQEEPGKKEYGELLVKKPNKKQGKE